MATENTIESFVNELQSLWSVEKLLTETMPQVIEKASNLGLKKNLAMHLAETDQQKEAIRGFCKTLGYPHEGDENNEFKNLLADGQKKMEEKAQGEALDAVIIDSAINVEHYEFERYTAVIPVAKALGYDGIAARLALSLEEERQADAKLNFLKKYMELQTAEAGAPDLASK